MVIIIGGGVFGLTIGWYLARTGRSVTIYEQGQAGRGASWAAAGMLMPWKLSDAFSPALFALQRESHRQWPEFAESLTAGSKTRLHYKTDGRYFVALTDKAVNRLRRQYEFHRELGFPVEWLSGAEVRRREPNLGPQVLAAIFTSMAHHVDNRRLVLALQEAFKQVGGLLQEQTKVQGVVIEERQVRGVRLEAEEIAAGETVILAAGAWSGQIPGLPHSLHGLIRPRKGQTLILQMPAGQPLLQHPVLGPVYLVPRADNRLVVGATVEREAGFDTQPTAGGVYHLLRKARDVAPGIKALPIVEMGAGLRPTGPNRLPVLGPTPVKGLIMATGGHSYGILLSPAVARAISHLVLSGEVSKMITPFAPG